MPSGSLPGMDSFVATNKPNLRITTIQDPNPLISYHADKWTRYIKSKPGATSHECGAKKQTVTSAENKGDGGQSSGSIRDTVPRRSDGASIRNTAPRWSEQLIPWFPGSPVSRVVEHYRGIRALLLSPDSHPLVTTELPVTDIWMVAPHYAHLLGNPYTAGRPREEKKKKQ
ncbi:hypothetical protein CRUP_020114 [Coryphaenoides rupestris]|nr:hypothetical protein CRUP_020114 [Coryphaenoides rupestris]